MLKIGRSRPTPYCSRTLAPRPAGSAGRPALFGALALAVLLAPYGVRSASAAARGSAVIGSGVTTKIGLKGQVVFTFVNYDAPPAHFSYHLEAAPRGIVLDADAGGEIAADGQSWSSLVLPFTVTTAAVNGAHQVTLSWTNKLTGDSGQAQALVELTPYDPFSPTLATIPSPVTLAGEASGAATTQAGCLTDSAGVAQIWNISLCPFNYRTTVEDPNREGSTILSVTPASGPLDVPEGAPTPIAQVVAPVGTEERVVVNVITLLVDVRLPVGTWTHAATARYVAVYSRENANLTPTQPTTWTGIKTGSMTRH